MKRVYNFGAGPAMLPTEVMKKAQAEFPRLPGAWGLCDGDQSSLQRI